MTLKSEILIWLIVLGQIFALLAPSSLLAQVSESSTDAFPTIQYDQNEEGFDDPYTFTVNVSDDYGVSSVSLLYRFDGEKEFRELEMNQVSDGIYSAKLPRDSQGDGVVRYYFLATDNQGNVVTKGFVFDPFFRVLVAQSQEMADTPTSDSISEPQGTKLRALYIALGLLVLGAVASAAGGGSGGDGSGPECVGGGCPITVTLRPLTD